MRAARVKPWMFLVSQCRGYTNAPIAKSMRLEEADAKIIDAMIL